MSDAQAAFAEWCEAHDVPHATACTTDEAIAVLEVWGCLRINFSGLRSKQHEALSR